MKKTMDFIGIFKKREGFTFLEVLVAVSVFSLGIAMIFRIYFNLTSTLKHLTNRTTANNVLDDAMWNVRKDLMYAQERMSESSKKMTNGVNPQYNIFIRWRKNPVYETIYDLEGHINWQEGHKNMVLGRAMCIRNEKL